MTKATNFNELYEQELKQLLEPFELERKSILNQGSAVSILAVISFICVVLAYTMHIGLLLIPIVLFIGIAIVIFVVYDQRKKAYVQNFKKTIVSRIINFIDPTFQYSPSLHVSERDYNKSGLYLTDPDNFRGDDYVEGQRDKTYFCFSELHTQQEVQNGKSTSLETIFKGLFFVGDFNKNFHGRTYVWNEVCPQLGIFSKMFSSFARNLEKVKLESVDFEERFIVYSTDQVEARYILTPTFMERMVKLELMMGPGLSISFIDTNIYVAIPIKDNLFEPSLWKPNSYTSLGDYYNTVHIVFDIIDELKLNLRIWNKE